MKTGDEILDMLDAWDENAESFRGTVLDDDRIAVLNKMKEIAQDIVKASRGELRCVPSPFDNHDKTASVIIRGEHPLFFLSKNIIDGFSKLFSLSDDVAIAIPENTQDIQLCFSVWNIWKEWRMENSPFTKNKK